MENRIKRKKVVRSVQVFGAGASIIFFFGKSTLHIRILRLVGGVIYCTNTDNAQKYRNIKNKINISINEHAEAPISSIWYSATSIGEKDLRRSLPI